MNLFEPLSTVDGFPPPHLLPHFMPKTPQVGQKWGKSRPQHFCGFQAILPHCPTSFALFICEVWHQWIATPDPNRVAKAALASAVSTSAEVTVLFNSALIASTGAPAH